MSTVDDNLYRTLGRLLFSILSRDSIEVQMSALTDAVASFNTKLVDVKASIAADVAHLRGLLDAAVAANAGDDAEIARLTEEADAAAASINAAVAEIGAIDAVPEFPAAPPA